VWQSCAPTASFDPSALSAKAAIRVAGGQTSRSALPANAPAPAIMASNSPSADFRPFIFQLPAISGRMASVMSIIPQKCQTLWLGNGLAEARREFQIPAR
jgi:hypothetical protein